ncbi:MAG: hypothetical protein Q9222_005195 [Ikaeria aurantiellina]
MEPESTFLRLPGEIRNPIYRLLLSARHLKLESTGHQDSSTESSGTGKPERWYNFHTSILRVNHQIYNEAYDIFRYENNFVKVKFDYELAVFMTSVAKELNRHQIPYADTAAAVIVDTLRGEGYKSSSSAPGPQLVYVLEDFDQIICDLKASALYSSDKANEIRIDFQSVETFTKFGDDFLKTALLVLPQAKFTFKLHNIVQGFESQKSVPAKAACLDPRTFLRYLRIILSLSQRCYGPPSTQICADAADMAIDTFRNILESSEPFEVNNPWAYWSFVIDTLLAMQSLIPRRFLDPSQRLMLLLMAFDTMGIHTPNKTFHTTWAERLYPRCKIYRSWVIAKAAFQAGDTPKAILEIKRACEKPWNVDADIETFKRAAQLEEADFEMPPDPNWLLHLSTEEIQDLELPMAAAAEPEAIV